MKKVLISRNTLVRFIKPSALTLLLAGTLSASSVQAADAKPKEVPVEVKYIGSMQGSPLFQIAFNNPEGNDISITLRDQEGYIIYTDVTNDKAYARKIRFDDLDFATMKLTLTLRSKKELQTKTFEVTRSSRVVEDFTVVSL